MRALGDVFLGAKKLSLEDKLKCQESQDELAGNFTEVLSVVGGEGSSNSSLDKLEEEKETNGFTWIHECVLAPNA